MVEAALCDLTQGELETEWHAWDKARRNLQKAPMILQDTFPDVLWRIHYGFGQIELAQKRKPDAFRHHLDAIHKIAKIAALSREYAFAIAIPVAPAPY